MKKSVVFLIFLFSLFLFSNAQTKNIETIAKNELEFSVFILNTTNYAFAKNFIPEFGYSRYLRKFFKTGFIFDRTKYSTGLINNNISLKTSFLPLSFFKQNNKFIANWEIELGLFYQFQFHRGTVQGVKAHNVSRKTFARTVISRKVYNGFYLFSSVDIWNNNTVFTGLRYRF